MRCSTTLLLVALALRYGSPAAHAGPDDPGKYRVAFIRPGAGGYNHGVTRVAAVGTKVLVGSPAGTPAPHAWPLLRRDALHRSHAPVVERVRALEPHAPAATVPARSASRP